MSVNYMEFGILCFGKNTRVALEYSKSYDFYKATGTAVVPHVFALNLPCLE